MVKRSGDVLNHDLGSHWQVEKADELIKTTMNTCSTHTCTCTAKVQYCKRLNSGVVLKVNYQEEIEEAQCLQHPSLAHLGLGCTDLAAVRTHKSASFCRDSLGPVQGAGLLEAVAIQARTDTCTSTRRTGQFSTCNKVYKETLVMAFQTSC